MPQQPRCLNTPQRKNTGQLVSLGTASDLRSLRPIRVRKVLVSRPSTHDPVLPLTNGGSRGHNHDSCGALGRMSQKDDVSNVFARLMFGDAISECRQVDSGEHRFAAPEHDGR